MDKGHLGGGGGGGGLLALDASPRQLGFLNLLSPAPFHRSMEADDGGGGGAKKNMKKSRASAGADAEDHKDQASAAGLAIKKEDLTINLLPGNNTRSDRSMVVDDDGASRADEDRNGRNTGELAAMQAELSRMNEENQRLRGMLTQVNSSYHALQMHLVALMQQRTQMPPVQPQQPPTHEDGKNESAIVPRQFLGLGPSGASADVAEEPSNSSTEVGSPRRSSSNGNEDPERGDNPDGPSTAGWLPGRGMSQQQQQQLGAAAKGHDQQAQEATMRKARVSVRARSEAPIVRLLLLLLDHFLVFALAILSSPCVWIVLTLPYVHGCRSPMDANGGSTVRRWPRETLAHAPTTAAPWPPAARCVSRYS
uniref:Uncharacterized protein n=1 Tax=Triticum urartu TaxID=4572 RepID=A0A8R7RCW5_TRIUA